MKYLVIFLLCLAAIAISLYCIFGMAPSYAGSRFTI